MPDRCPGDFNRAPKGIHKSKRVGDVRLRAARRSWTLAYPNTWTKRVPVCMTVTPHVLLMLASIKTVHEREMLLRWATNDCFISTIYVLPACVRVT